MPRKQSIAEQAMGICVKTAEPMGYEVCDVSFDKESTGMYLRIYIDRDGGITLDDCEKFHRAVQSKLENLEYDFLEVCSPGIDRPIKTKRDIEKSIGLEVEVKLYRAQEGSKSFTGLLRAMDDETVTICLPDQTEKTFTRRDAAQVRLVPDLSGLDERSGQEIQDIIDDK